MKKLILGLATLIALTFVACEKTETSYTVLFDTDGGSLVMSQTVEEGDTIIKPATPTKDGYEFNYWKKDGVAYDFSTPVNDFVTLIADWKTAGPALISFEEVVIEEDGVNNGIATANTTGILKSGIATLSYSYGSYTTWSGFAITNHANDTTAGYTNMYSCIAAAGAEGSANFAVFNQSGDSIKFDSAINLESIMICNNTFAALSMTDGDSFSKKFEAGDYFKLTIKLFDENNSSVGEVNTYLADFRDGKSIILKEWEKVDLSSFNNVSYMKFSFESTDNGEWGMNTPAYFCIDNIAYYEAE